MGAVADGVGLLVQMFGTVSWLDGLGDLPERIFTDEIVEVVEECDDLSVLVQFIVADRHTQSLEDTYRI